MKNRVYGYARISTMKQSIERQIRNIKAEYPDAVIVSEKYTGTTIDRPEWNKIYKKLNAGDKVVFDSVSRMSRDADEGFKLYEELYNKGVELVFLKEPHINTETYKKALESNVTMTGTNVDYILEGVNKYLMALAKEQIMIAFEQAEKEVQDLHQRTKEGIETARLNGKQIGRAEGTKVTTKKSIEVKKIIMENSKDFNGSLSDVNVMKLINADRSMKVQRNTYYRYKSQLKSKLSGNEGQQ
jgi:DNA invertase Pin-like site-specific DNA recombinase